MKVLRDAGIIALSVLIIHAEDRQFSVSAFGVGPVTLHTTLTHEGDGERLVAAAKNESGVAIQHAKICVRAFESEFECLFELSNTALWAPGIELKWNLTTPKKLAKLAHYATIEHLDVTKTTEAAAAFSSPALAVEYSNPMLPRGPILTIQDGTPLRMRLTRNLSSSEAQAGDRVDFEVLDDVRVANSVVIANGAMAVATITDAESKRNMGRAGRLDVSLDYVRSVFGEKIRLRGVQNTKAGGHVGAMTGAMVATAVVFWPAAPLFLFMKGKDVKIPQGHEVTVYVNGDQQVQGLGAPAVPYETNEKAAPRPTITGKPMTNEDVLTLKAAGFGEDFIVSRIKVASPSFTLDTPDLVKLKQAGLSDAVIGAMVQAPGSPPTAPVPPTLDPAQAARGTTPALSAVEQGPEEPELSGIFYALDGSKLIPLERQDAAVQIGVGGVFVMNGKGVIKFAGAHSPVRIRYAQSLDFIVRSPADADRGSLYHLRRLEIRKSDREVTVVSEHASPLGATVKANDQNIVSVGYSRYGTHSVRITATELQPGEYAIGAQGGKIVFCFGVD